MPERRERARRRREARERRRYRGYHRVGAGFVVAFVVAVVAFAAWGHAAVFGWRNALVLLGLTAAFVLVLATASLVIRAARRPIDPGRGYTAGRNGR